ncbi:hypothetical protein [Planctomyces sp. SH-PL62]|uniref:hypothetical protein n=1 Tax=Planctomyces sp. SH-PL62 TaxID=1636152 RepID=UPI00078DA0D9|nr:hypothetical protein [Planctomyces sp. SH-PL62]AMV39171.1 hypothetical protein VT85_17165 [Planctomyces sp. SH-PL62]
MSHTEYTPGVCNIGGAEVRLRKLLGWAGLVGAVALWGCFLWAGVSPATRLWVGGPALMSALGFLQARRRFCVNYGFGGVSSFGPQAGATETVEDAESRAVDRRTSWRIVGTSVAIALIVAVAAYLTPT